MANVASLLLVILKPAEVYYLLLKMCETSDSLFKTEEGIGKLRWYFTYEKPGYLKTVSTFVKSYLNSTMRGKRSVLQHFKKIHFDFYKFIDLSFRSLLGHFLSLPLALEILTSFLAGGIKVIFRYTYAIMKYHKAFIKTIQAQDHFIEKLRTEARANTVLPKLLKFAFKYKIKPSQYDFKAAKIEDIQHKGLGGADISNEYLP